MAMWPDTGEKCMKNKGRSLKREKGGGERDREGGRQSRGRQHTAFPCFSTYMGVNMRISTVARTTRRVLTSTVSASLTTYQLQSLTNQGPQQTTYLPRGASLPSLLE